MKTRDLFDAGVDNLLEERKLYKDMRSVASTAAKDLDVKARSLMALKDYKHYYGRDWAYNNPLTPLPKEDLPDGYRCRMSQPFRKMVDIINVLKETGELEMLDPIIQALAVKGIELKITDDINYDRKDDVEEYVEHMDSFQSSICILADERKDLRKQVKELRNGTISSYNEYVVAKANLSSPMNDKKRQALTEHIHDLILDNTVEGDIYTTLSNEL